jgi:hypothetical protein
MIGSVRSRCLQWRRQACHEWDDQCSGVGCRTCDGSIKFPVYLALTEQLLRIGLTVFEAVCRDSWRVFHIGTLLCLIDSSALTKSRRSRSILRIPVLQ